LQVTLHVDGGGWRVNPTSGDEQEDSEQPESAQRDEKR
jgi:hypothetical protein